MSNEQVGEGLHTYSLPHNSEGADRQAKGQAHPMNPRNDIRTVCRIGKEARGEILRHSIPHGRPEDASEL